MRARIRDVAQAAGVSATTVSRYLGKTLRLPQETAERIDHAIRRLDYQPSITAQRLMRGTTEAIGLATPDIANPFFAALAAAVEEQAAARGYHVILCSTGNRLEQELAHLRRLAAGHVDALLFLTNRGDDGALRAALHRHRHVVLLDEDVPGVQAPRVFVENDLGGMLATTCLLRAGHRRIAHVTGPANLLSVRERLAGFGRGMQAAGVPVDPALILHGAYERGFGRSAAAALLDRADPPTAIFAASDYIAIGILDTLRSRGLAVPRDMSLVGFDDMAFADLLDPPLTTVRQPIGLIGEQGVAAVLKLLDGDPGPDDRPITRLPVTLIERRSVAGPRAG